MIETFVMNHIEGVLSLLMLGGVFMTGLAAVLVYSVADTHNL
jgi:hypothetical protein